MDLAMIRDTYLDMVRARRPSEMQQMVADGTLKAHVDGMARDYFKEIRAAEQRAMIDAVRLPGPDRTLRVLQAKQMANSSMAEMILSEMDGFVTREEGLEEDEDEYGYETDD